MATIPDTRYQRSIDTDTRYRYWKWRHRHALFEHQQSDSLAFVLRVSQHEVGGSWLIYNQRQWKCFTCCQKHRAVPIGRWYVLDCQEWAKRPLAASRAQWMNRGGWHGCKRRLNWKGRGTWGGRRRVELSCHSVVVGSLGRSCDVLLGGRLTVGRVATSQACFNYQQLASLTNDVHACLHVNRWPRRLQCL